MKIKITLKDPDGVYDSIQRAAESGIKALGLSKQEEDLLIESRREGLDEACGKWIKFGEYVTIEIDTEAGTATVCKV